MSIKKETRYFIWLVCDVCRESEGPEATDHAEAHAMAARAGWVCRTLAFTNNGGELGNVQLDMCPGCFSDFLDARNHGAIPNVNEIVGNRIAGE